MALSEKHAKSVIGEGEKEINQSTSSIVVAGIGKGVKSASYEAPCVCVVTIGYFKQWCRYSSRALDVSEVYPVWSLVLG
jgi:hypothetical protein